MKRILALLLLALAAVPAAAETLSGPATVIDGDTLEIAGRLVRLVGIDAPEGTQPCTRDGEVWDCGEESARQLRALIGTNDVVCQGDELDQYDRLLAVCRAGRFALNRTLVEYGWATAFRSYSDAYVADEIRAKMQKRGIWSSTFELPQAYRLAQRQSTARPSPRPTARRTQAQPTLQGDCAIKGNRSRRGEWIYHLPGMPYYDATRAEEMFCSEAEARAAGYRRAIVR
ncbi:thermonuclease family protein [Aurantiacibacter flavus]|uniref:Thermonuclease family protein n=1 Tax=Aurantiacibacter flavus TaxID=3145232 RepID=A0ABV0D0V7_9SPHN